MSWEMISPASSSIVDSQMIQFPHLATLQKINSQNSEPNTPHLRPMFSTVERIYEPKKQIVNNNEQLKQNRLPTRSAHQDSYEYQNINVPGQ